MRPTHLVRTAHPLWNKTNAMQSNDCIGSSSSRISIIVPEGKIMDIRMPEMFGWHPKKDERPETGKTSEPSPYTKWITLTALVLLVLAMAGLTAYYFSDYLNEVFNTLKY